MVRPAIDNANAPHALDCVNGTVGPRAVRFANHHARVRSKDLRRGNHFVDHHTGAHRNLKNDKNV